MVRKAGETEALYCTGRTDFSPAAVELSVKGTCYLDNKQYDVRNIDWWTGGL